MSSKSYLSNLNTACIFGSKTNVRGVLGWRPRGKAPPRDISEANFGPVRCLGLYPRMGLNSESKSEDSSDFELRAKYAGCVADTSKNQIKVLSDDLECIPRFDFLTCMQWTALDVIERLKGP